MTKDGDLHHDEVSLDVLALEMGVTLGHQVGYQIGGDAKVNQGVEKSRLIYMTEGALLQQMLTDVDLSKYSCIIIDEAHERSVEIDILMAFLKRAMRRHKDLKCDYLRWEETLAWVDINSGEALHALLDVYTEGPTRSARKRARTSSNTAVEDSSPADEMPESATKKAKGEHADGGTAYDLSAYFGAATLPTVSLAADGKMRSPETILLDSGADICIFNQREYFSHLQPLDVAVSPVADRALVWQEMGESLDLNVPEMRENIKALQAAVKAWDDFHHRWIDHRSFNNATDGYTWKIAANGTVTRGFKMGPALAGRSLSVHSMHKSGPKL
ncbi:unnamed protein product [Clonostachys rosea]|uniref:Helicase ATP-binding domain-containing protein n=1 Tax=Bionectria ochroleuca TaxID=29856 RepID=A0ABY6UF83_BIOOC|nr:unnamed protein product [Clonostachys rosea]